MPPQISRLISHWAQRHGISIEQAQELYWDLAKQLSPGQLSQWLMPIMQQQSERLTPAELFRRWSEHGLSQPAEDTLSLKEEELQLLRRAKAEGFSPVSLSPVTPLGTVSAYEKISQHQVLSALKTAEVVSDSSNVLALLLTHRWKQRQQDLRLSTVHRVLRPLAAKTPQHKAHFLMFTLAELIPQKSPEALIAGMMRQLKVQTHALASTPLRLRLLAYPGDHRLFERLKSVLGDAQNLSPHWHLEWVSAPAQNTYYLGCRVLIDVQRDRTWLNLSDLGIVDWPARLSGQGHLRLVISGTGVERRLGLRKGREEREDD